MVYFEFYCFFMRKTEEFNRTKKMLLFCNSSLYADSIHAKSTLLVWITRVLSIGVGYVQICTPRGSACGSSSYLAVR